MNLYKIESFLVKFMPKISVIIPCYNVEDFVEECLDSVINQTFEDMEIICINDGSTDNTLSILESYAKRDNRIKILNQNNQGLSASRNRALEMAKGEYIFFLDSDDYIELTTFEELIRLAEEKCLDLIIFNLRNFDNETKEEQYDKYYDMPFLKEIVGDNVFNYKDLGYKMLILSVTAPGKLFKREIIQDLRFPVGLIFEDNPFFTEVMFKAKRVFFLDEQFYNRRVHLNSITNSSTDKFSDWIEISNILFDILKKYDYFEVCKKAAYFKKFYGSYKFLTLVDETEKKDFFERIKKDFASHKDDYESIKGNFRYKRKLDLILNSALEFDSHEEFELTVRNYEITAKNNRLKKRNDELKKEIKEYEKINKTILNSTSWKITKPSRQITNFFRNFK